MTDRQRSHWRFISLIILVLPVVSGYSAPEAAAREETVEARGIAEFAGRKDLAREQALAEAFRQAVRQALGVMVESESLVRNEVVVTDQVLSRSNGLVKKYSIVSEGVSDGVYTVDIRAVVSAVRLKKALDSIGLTARKMGKPRITVLLMEGDPEPKVKPAAPSRKGYGVAEAQIHDVLIRKGFDFIDSRSLGLQSDSASPVTDEVLAKLAKSGDIEMIITGTANARSSAPISGTSLHPCQATVSIRALNVDNGEVLASHAARAAAPHINPATGEAEAMGKAAGEAAERVAQQVLASWKGKVDGVRTVRLVVTGVDGYDDLKLFKKSMTDQIEDVEEVWERSFEADTAKMDVEIASSARDLADRLSSLSVQGKPVNVTSFTANVVQIALGKRTRK
jgi:hypothetical protein